MSSYRNSVEARSIRANSLNQRSGLESKPPLKIAMVIPSIRSGGAERVALSVSRGLAGRGHRVDMVCFGDQSVNQIEIPENMHLVDLYTSYVRRNGRTQKYLVKRTAEVYLHALKKINWKLSLIPSMAQIQRSMHFSKYLEAVKPDCIVSHMHRATEVSWLASSMLRQPIPVLPVVHNMGSEIKKNRQRYRFWNALSQVQDIVAVSRVVKEAIVRQSTIPEAKISVIYNGVPVEEIAFLSKDKPNHKWFKDWNVPIVLGVGRLVPQKDFPTLLQAFRLLRKRIDCRLLILGSGPEACQLKQLSEQLNIAECFDLVPFTDNPYSYMGHSAVVGLSSKFEGFPMVPLEALACGCPCVCTDRGGQTEVITEEFGKITPVGDYSAFADALHQTVMSPPERSALRQYVKKYSLEECVRNYEKLIESVVALRDVTKITKY